MIDRSLRFVIVSVVTVLLTAGTTPAFAQTRGGAEFPEDDDPAPTHPDRLTIQHISTGGIDRAGLT